MSDPSLSWSDDKQHRICDDCIEWFSLDELYVDPNGVKWTICQACGERSEVAQVFLFMSQGRINNHPKIG